MLFCYPSWSSLHSVITESISTHYQTVVSPAITVIESISIHHQTVVSLDLLLMKDFENFSTLLSLPSAKLTCWVRFNQAVAVSSQLVDIAITGWLIWHLEVVIQFPTRDFFIFSCNILISAGSSFKSLGPKMLTVLSYYAYGDPCFSQGLFLHIISYLSLQ